MSHNEGMGEPLRIGPHSVIVEGDIARLTLAGDLDLDQIKSITAILEGIAREHGSWGGLVDVRGLGKVSPEARHHGGAWTQKWVNFATAVFGASVAARVVVTLISRAAELATGRSRNVAFFKTETEAAAWLRKQPRPRK